MCTFYYYYYSGKATIALRAATTKTTTSSSSSRSISAAWGFTVKLSGKVWKDFELNQNTVCRCRIFNERNRYISEIA
jgi:hypothetical protein